MRNPEQAIRIAAKLYEARDAMQRLMGARYFTAVGHWRAVVRACMARHACPASETPLHLEKDLSEAGHQLDGSETAMLFSAVVEEIEHAAR